MCNMILSAIICGSPFFLSGNADNIVKYSKICEKNKNNSFGKAGKRKQKRSSLVFGGKR